MTFDDPLHFKHHSIIQDHALGYQSGDPDFGLWEVIYFFVLIKRTSFYKKLN